MRKTMNKLASTLALFGGLLVASTASADGLVASAGELPDSARQQLEQAIGEHRAENPAIYQTVRNVRGYKPGFYKKQRNPIPLVGRELRRLGPEALLPMLEALAFDVWERDGATDAEWRALKVGMLEAVGAARDLRSAPVLQVAFTKDLHPDVLRAAAQSMGDICDDTSLSMLDAALSTSKRGAAIVGLGHCRTAAAAGLLTAQLDKTKSAAEADGIARALGFLSSSWAWRALGKSRHAEGLQVRRMASEALVRAFVRFDGRARTGARVGLTMAEHPDIRSIASLHRGAATTTVIKALDVVIHKVEKRTRN